MKKLFLALICLLMLCGCSAAASEAGVSGGEEVLFSSPKKSYTKADLNKEMKMNDFSSVLMPEIMKLIGEAEGIDVEAIEAEAVASIDELKAMGYESYIAYYYGSEAIYLANYVSSAIITKLNEAIIEADLDTYLTEYAPVKAEIAYFDTLEQIEAVRAEVAEGSTFAYAASNNGYGYDVVERIYTDQDDQPLEVKEYLLSATELGLGATVNTTTTIKDSEGNETVSPRYYLVNLISKDINDYRADFITRAAEDLDTNTTVTNALAKHNVRLYDQAAYKLMSATYEVLK